jgi:hypothetical protein
MPTRTIVIVLLLLSASLGWPMPARAQSALTGIDGCAILAAVVYTEVTAARLGYLSATGGNPLYTGRNEMSLCNEATRSVTRAFTAALRRSNLYITWGFHSGYSGDHCLSQFLSECYPAGDPAMPPFGKEDRSFVLRSWEAVQGAVRGSMALSPGSDVARFNGVELRRSIRRSMYGGGIEDHPHLAVPED